jgi:dTDP-4-dehydrorhamnose 3,5-epimerase-like enzyme
MHPRLRYTVLENSGDHRGASFPAPTGWTRLLGTIRDSHITTVLPGNMRGNHFHARKKEVLMVLSTGEWQLCWDDGPDSAIQSEIFRGLSAVVVEIPEMVSHAVANTGAAPLWIVGLSNELWDESAPDAQPRVVFPSC